MVAHVVTRANGQGKRLKAMGVIERLTNIPAQRGSCLRLIRMIRIHGTQIRHPVFMAEARLVRVLPPVFRRTGLSDRKILIQQSRRSWNSKLLEGPLRSCRGSGHGPSASEEAGAAAECDGRQAGAGRIGVRLRMRSSIWRSISRWGIVAESGEHQH